MTIKNNSKQLKAKIKKVEKELLDERKENKENLKFLKSAANKELIQLKQILN